MSGETGSNESGWTTDTLLAHMRAMFAEQDLRYEQRFLAQEKAQADREQCQKTLDEERGKHVQQAFDAATKAVSKAEVATEKRFDGVNEFRAALADQAHELMPRSEFEVQHAALVNRIGALEKQLIQVGGRSQGLNAAVGYVFAVIGALVGIVGVALALTR